MKRLGNLIEKIADYDNLYWAYWKAKRGKNSKKEVLAYGLTIESNLLKLQNSILVNQCEIGNYHFFKIYEPKERQICAASFGERVLHHAIMNVCHQSFEKFQVFDSYATRTSKGTYSAINRAVFFQKKYTYFMKIDCKKYFDSIDHAILKTQISRRFKDELLLNLLFQIIDSYQVSPNKGLPIGNLTSQYFANHYLAHADRYLIETLHAPAIVRYMDDILIWHNDNLALQKIGQQFKEFCNVALKIEFKHQYQNKTSVGVSFLGVFMWKSHQTLNSQSKKSLILKYESAENQFFNDRIDETTYHKKLSSLMIRPLKVKSYRFRKQLIWNTNERKGPSGRQLLQQCRELPSSESQQPPPRPPQQQQRFSVGFFPQLKPDSGY